MDGHLTPLDAAEARPHTLEAARGALSAPAPSVADEFQGSRAFLAIIAIIAWCAVGVLFWTALCCAFLS